jgi:hypothetical protein
MFKSLLVVIVLGSFGLSLAQTPSRRHQSIMTPPPGYWPLEKSYPIVEKTQEIRLAPDLSQLSAGERAAVGKLLEVGKIFQDLYEDQRHKQALVARRNLRNLHKIFVSPAPVDMYLFTLYRLNQGPIATTLDNKREPFLPVDPVVPVRAEDIGVALKLMVGGDQEVSRFRDPDTNEYAQRQSSYAPA